MSRLRITPFLWFDNQAVEAAHFYASIFPNSKVEEPVLLVGEGDAGAPVTVVSFELDGLPLTALNGGPMFKFSEAVSFLIECETQEEIDYYWEKLTAGSDPASQQCGWFKDKFGLSWQVAPSILTALLSGPDRAKSQRVMAKLMTMIKLDLAALQQAYDG